MKQRFTRAFTNLFLPKFGLLACVCLLFCSSVYAQDLPDKIRGYKVYKADIAVKNSAEKTEKKNDFEAFVKINEPVLSDVSLTGITFELSAEIESIEQSGNIDFLSFQDFRVNGLAVEVEEYKNPFSFKKNEKIILPKPARIFLSTPQTLRGVYKEVKDSKEDWLVTGKVFVFGKFKKFGFSFKRVIPIEINLKIKNPLKS
ncbi:MAG TPA: hypothetical protein PKY59_23490 [Pyrinomonadaceae bacterium]|nr:hypothetical protein [Pyrinomonadaceae bacterium]